MSQYEKNFNRIAECVEKRADLMGRKPRLSDVVDQLSIRGRVFSQKTINLEITSVRSILVNGEMRTDGIWLGEGIQAREWITLAGEREFETARRKAQASNKEILEVGTSIIDREILNMGAALDTMTREEVVDALAGRARNEQIRHNPKDQRYLTSRDLERIDLDLSDHDRAKAILSVLTPDSQVDISGLLRVFINAIWHSGMRPIELWSSRLLVPNTEIPSTPEMIEMIRKNPEQAVMQEYLMLVEKSAAIYGETDFGAAAVNAVNRSGAPCVLMIRSAKQTNANKATATPIRMQVQEGAPYDVLFNLGLASQLRAAKITRKRADGLHSSMNRVLERIVSDHPFLADLKVNLYSFRHSFATRVKLKYDPWEAAALTGHSSRSSLYAYGERNLRSARGRRPEGWTPAPDPVQAETIRVAWSRAAEPGLEAKPGA